MTTASKGLLSVAAPCADSALRSSWARQRRLWLPKAAVSGSRRTFSELSRSRLRHHAFSQQATYLRWREPCTFAAARRCYSTSETSPPSPPRPLPSDPSAEPVQREVPSYDLTFTCKPCKTRSTHRISKQGYHKGTVLITCPQCKNRHLIADHLKIFQDQAMTIDKYLEQQGEVVKRGALGPDGDIEIWDQNTDDPSTGRHVGAPFPPGENPSEQEQDGRGDR